MAGRAQGADLCVAMVLRRELGMECANDCLLKSILRLRRKKFALQNGRLLNHGRAANPSPRVRSDLQSRTIHMY